MTKQQKLDKAMDELEEGLNWTDNGCTSAACVEALRSVAYRVLAAYRDTWAGAEKPEVTR